MYILSSIRGLYNANIPWKISPKRILLFGPRCVTWIATKGDILMNKVMKHRLGPVFLILPLLSSGSLVEVLLTFADSSRRHTVEQNRRFCRYRSCTILQQYKNTIKVISNILFPESNTKVCFAIIVEYFFWEQIMKNVYKAFHRRRKSTVWSHCALQRDENISVLFK